MKIQTLLVASVLVFSFSACKKEDKTIPTPTPVSPKATAQSDQQGSSAADSGIDDVNDYVNNKIGGGATHKRATYDLPCGVISADSSTDANGKKTYSLKYGGKTPCGYKYKSGTISFKLVNGTSFGDQGAVTSITFTNYSVQSNATNDVITVNGTLYTTNVNGGYVWQSVILGSTIVHKVRGTFTTTYANSATRDKSYYQLRTWSSSNGWPGLTFRLTGDTLINSAKISETGKTLDGNHDYKTEISEDFLMSNCGTDFKGPFVLKFGIAKLNVDIPGVSPAYFQIQAGYNYVNAQTTPLKVNDCNSNAYQITTAVGASTKTEYQQY